MEAQPACAEVQGTSRRGEGLASGDGDGHATLGVEPGDSLDTDVEAWYASAVAGETCGPQPGFCCSWHDAEALLATRVALAEARGEVYRGTVERLLGPARGADDVPDDESWTSSTQLAAEQLAVAGFDVDDMSGHEIRRWALNLGLGRAPDDVASDWSGGESACPSPRSREAFPRSLPSSPPGLAADLDPDLIGAAELDALQAAQDAGVAACGASDSPPQW